MKKHLVLCILCTLCCVAYAQKIKIKTGIEVLKEQNFKCLEGINWQLAYQTRSIENDYALFTNNVNNPITPRTFKGEAFAPVIPLTAS